MAPDSFKDLDALDRLSAVERATALAALGREVLATPPSDLHDTLRGRLVKSLVEAIESGAGAPRDRLALGVALGTLGDPRLRSPDDPAYFAQVDSEDGPFLLGRYLVTNRDYRSFVADRGYERSDLWEPAGLAWLGATRWSWPKLAERDDAGPYIIDNQPVVGVTWHEASAFARWAGGRLPTFEERLGVVRGREKRPYPWGAPFGEGNANTQEEVLNQPTAVGLYPRDRSPEGVYDLAGNVAEWCADGVGTDKWVHPGAWDQPSMAAWAKARVLQSAAERSTALGFRIARDSS